MSDNASPDVWRETAEGLEGFISDVEAQLTDAITDLQNRLSVIEVGPHQATNSQLPWTSAVTPVELASLVAWVDWLNTTYELPYGTAVAACWQSHAGVAEQLAALWHAWLAARTSQAADTTEDMISWHERWLWPSLPRFADVTKECQGGRNHQEPRPSPLTNDYPHHKPLPRPAFTQKPVV